MKFLCCACRPPSSLLSAILRQRKPQKKRRQKVTIKADPIAFSQVQKTVLAKLPAVASSQVSAEAVVLSIYSVGCRGSEILAAFREAGLPAQIEKWESGNEEALAHDQVGLLRKLVLSVCLTLPLLWNPSPLFQFALATLILLIPASVFMKGATRALHGGMNMDVLIVISSLLVYGYSTYLAFTVTEDIKLYFLCEGVLVSLVLFGRYLEIVARGETDEGCQKGRRRAKKNPKPLENLGVLGLAEKEGFGTLRSECRRAGIRQVSTGHLHLGGSNPSFLIRQRKEPLTLWGERFFSLAEKEGFEPSIPFWGIHDFQSCALGQLRDFSICAARFLPSQIQL